MGGGGQWSSPDGGHLVPESRIKETRQRVIRALTPDIMRWRHKQASNKTTEMQALGTHLAATVDYKLSIFRVRSVFTDCPEAQDGPTHPGHSLLDWTYERKNPDFIPVQPSESSLPAAPALDKPRSGFRQPPFPEVLHAAVFATVALVGSVSSQSPPGKPQRGNVPRTSSGNLVMSGNTVSMWFLEGLAYTLVTQVPALPTERKLAGVPFLRMDLQHSFRLDSCSL